MATARKVVELHAWRKPQAPPTGRYRQRDPGAGEGLQLLRDEWSLDKPEKGGFFRTLVRLVGMLAAALYFGILLAVTIGIRDPRRRIRRRGVLLRDLFQRLGGAFIKIGQQLSMRRDMLPAEYCDALKELLDRVTEFDFELARKAIAEQIGGPVESVFSGLDPDPIGRASVACVYQAWLCEPLKQPVRVAIKVRRPGIVKLFAADLRALDWIMIVLEYFTIVRGGVSKNFRDQLKQILFDELDFRKEARYQELFRRRYRKCRSYRVTAPKVFYRYSGKGVMVSEYIDAIRLESITGAVEAGDEEYLAYLRSLGIEPVPLAKRLIRYNFHAFFEDTFFHGDPHPANIFVLPKNELVFVDFGACGTFSKRDRHLMLQMHYFHSQKDIRGMVECVIGLMEPLPPINVDEFRRKLEKEYWDGYYGLQSKHSDWRDRTSYRLWVALYDLVREYEIPMPLNMLRMIRATLLYDTIAAQLYNEIDVFKEFRKYDAKFARRVREELFRDACRQALLGPDLGWYVWFRRVVDTGKTALLRLQKFVDEPGFSPQAFANKIYYVIGTVSSWLVSVMTLGGAFAVTAYLMDSANFDTQMSNRRSTLPLVLQFLNPLQWYHLWNREATDLVFGFLLFAVTIAHLNALRQRFNDPDRHLGRGSAVFGGP
jgi:predicted unusual protein kinase regulating ubiquinone biosynthesis (AarF/ABC1/UbiB family)